MLAGQFAEQAEILLRAGGVWRASPYVRTALEAAGASAQAFQIPVYQSAVLELLARGQLPRPLYMRDFSEPAGLGTVAVLDALLANLSTAALFGAATDLAEIRIGPAAEVPALRAFRDAVVRRSDTLNRPPFFNPILKVTEATPSANDYAPNLVLVHLPRADAVLDAGFINSLAAGCILIVVEWQQAGQSPRLFSWRKDWLNGHAGWSAFGPCGQEYGRDLPLACDGCVHGQRASLHDVGISADEDIPVWSYALLIKSLDAVEPLPDDVINANTLKIPYLEHAHARYIGTVQKAAPVADNPDAAHDDPADTGWQEYLRVCPGHSGATRLALERRAGMQVPPLRYGQWLALEKVQPGPLSLDYPNVPVLRVRNEAAFMREEAGPAERAFLPGYEAVVHAAADEAGYRLFGFERMWPFQHAAFARSLTGQNLFAIAATGGGKSECYILPAMLLPGITLVIAPLKSLILDQYEQRLRSRYGLVARATFINSDVSFHERQGRLRRMILGHFKLVYVTPEQLERGYVLDSLRQADQQVGVRYIAFDEAHCISQWGHDFRPSYLNIVRRLEDYGLRPIRIALTATASPLVRDDVCAELQLDARLTGAGGDVLVEASNRPELNLVVRRVRSTEEKTAIITDELRKLGDQGSAIVFMPHTGGTPEHPRLVGYPVHRPGPQNVGMTSSGVTPFAGYLARQLGRPVALYHGALDDEAQDGRETGGLTRQAEQRAFMSGEKRIMVATKGFGMGVDKPDIRLVIHRSPPANLEAYAQEAGRAGRDQQPATVLLLFSEDSPRIVEVQPDRPDRTVTISSDRDIQQYFIDHRYVRHSDLRAVIAFLRSNRPGTHRGRLYFTSDQVVQFLNECGQQPALASLSQPYAWPDWPARTPGGRFESLEHRAVLEAGYRYQHRRDYIQNILDVLYSTQPLLRGTPTPIFRSLHEVGTHLVRFRLLQPVQLLEATAYFGERFRTAGLSLAELKQLLPDGDRVDLAPLARRMELSLAETASMLRDIRMASGRTNHYNKWTGTWLDFWGNEAPRLVPLADPYAPVEWRQYAGAGRRAHAPAGSSVDDYFPAAVLNRPYGWEATPGSGLNYPDAEAYISDLLRIHDSRQANDQTNFNHLVEQYIGAGDGPAKCLRSILLGYLKTGEVVVGGKCYSCSVCVPDLTFADYSLEKRREVVTHLFAKTAQLIEEVEAVSRRRPASELLEQLLDAIESEEAAGRSGRTYLDSWLTRLTQDDPDHQGALWLRLQRHRTGRLDWTPAAAVADLDRLTRAASALADLAELRAVVEAGLQDSRLAAVHPRLTACLARLCARLDDWSAEAEAWMGVVTSPSHGDAAAGVSGERVEALRRLLALYRPNGPLFTAADAGAIAQDAATRLARLPDTSFETARDGYSVVVPGWTWQQVQTEVAAAGTPAHIGLIIAWLQTEPDADNLRVCAEQIGDLKAEWGSWPTEALSVLEERLGTALGTQPDLLADLAGLAIRLPNGTAVTTRLALRLWLATDHLEPSWLEHLSAQLSSLDMTSSQALLGADVSRSRALLEQLLITGQAQNLGALLQRFPAAVVESLPAERLWPVIKTKLATGQPLDSYLQSALSRQLDGADNNELVETLKTELQTKPLPTVALLAQFTTEPQVPVKGLTALFPALVAARGAREHQIQLLDRLVPLTGQLESSSLARILVEAWGILRTEQPALRELRTAHIDGKFLVRFVERWLSARQNGDQLDLLVLILEDIRTRSAATWLTPRSLLFQVLCAAGRYDEAQTGLAHGLYREISIKGTMAVDFLRRTRARLPERRPRFVTELHWLWRLAQ